MEKQTTKIGKFTVEYFPEEVIRLHQELDEHHKDLQMVMPTGCDLITTLNWLAATVGIELDGEYLIKDVAEAIRIKLVSRRLIVVVPSEQAEFLAPYVPPKEE